MSEPISPDVADAYAMGAATERERICAWLTQVAANDIADAPAMAALPAELASFVGAVVSSTIAGLADLLRNPHQEERVS